ncbi:helix-turn-helix transcriptional regulator [Clostridiaceae bacterium M8S5]|nr:helix-turn-helix transcriptional regulator [Clostridiaceae bacterium M8S5]
MQYSIEDIKLIAKAIAAQFGKNTEVVVHDFSKGYDSTIVAIENGHVTNRSIGGCPTNLFLEEIRKDNNKRTNFRYTTHTKDGKVLRSSTVNFFDNGKRMSSICINHDITDYINLEKVYLNLTKNDCFGISSEILGEEIHTQSIKELLEELIVEALSTVNVPVNKMNKVTKLQVIKFLDDKGVFLIQKSGDRICELLKISKFTLYNYLDEIRMEITD